MISEEDEAFQLANCVLDRVNADPDDDLEMLARQFLRCRERAMTALTVLPDAKIGARDAAAKAQPLLDALEDSTDLLLHTRDENDEGAIAEQIKINRAAIEAYRRET